MLIVNVGKTVTDQIGEYVKAGNTEICLVDDSMEGYAFRYFKVDQKAVPEEKKDFVSSKSPGAPGISITCKETGEVFESMKEAAKAFGCAAPSIRYSVTTGGTCCGYHFYKTGGSKVEQQIRRKPKGIPVRCHELNKVFDSEGEAAKYVDCSPSSIRYSVQNVKMCKGYHFHLWAGPESVEEFEEILRQKKQTVMKKVRGG